MSSKIGLNELRVVIRPIEAPGFEAGLIPAPLFKKVFDAFLAALVAADRELHTKSISSQFFISHLGFGACEFGITEKQRTLEPGRGSAVEFFRQSAERIYRSDYQALLRYPRLTRAFHRIVKSLAPGYAVLVRNDGGELPMDGFFCRQLCRAGSSDPLTRTDGWFAGAKVASFEGRLEALDYRGPIWRGRLALRDGENEIECVFDSSKGEDSLNPFGNKNVCVTGRAIYTGDSDLPERVEVLMIEPSARARSPLEAPRHAAPATQEDPADGVDQSSGLI